MEAHSKQRGQPPRTHEFGKLKYGQEGQKLPPFHWSKETSTSGAQGEIGKEQWLHPVTNYVQTSHQTQDFKHNKQLMNYTNSFNNSIAPFLTI